MGLLVVEIVECGGDESGGVVGGAFVLGCRLAVACISGVCGVAAVGESASCAVGALVGPMHAPAMGARRGRGFLGVWGLLRVALLVSGVRTVTSGWFVRGVFARVAGLVEERLVEKCFEEIHVR